MVKKLNYYIVINIVDMIFFTSNIGSVLENDFWTSPLISILYMTTWVCPSERFLDPTPGIFLENDFWIPSPPSPYRYCLNFA